MLTPEQLKLTQQEVDALVWVRNELASGRLEHVPRHGRGGGFNMDIIHTKRSCGSVACIGGWMGLKMGLTADALDEFVTGHLVLRTLFFPRSEAETEGGDDDGYGTEWWGLSYASITPVQAIAAIDNALHHGEPRWAEVLGFASEVKA